MLRLVEQQVCSLVLGSIPDSGMSGELGIALQQKWPATGRIHTVKKLLLKLLQFEGKSPVSAICGQKSILSGKTANR